MNEASQSEKTLLPVFFLDELFLYHTILGREKTFRHDRSECYSKAKHELKFHEKVN